MADLHRKIDFFIGSHLRNFNDLACKILMTAARILSFVLPKIRSGDANKPSTGSETQ